MRFFSFGKNKESKRILSWCEKRLAETEAGLMSLSDKKVHEARDYGGTLSSFLWSITFSLSVSNEKNIDFHAYGLIPPMRIAKKGSDETFHFRNVYNGLEGPAGIVNGKVFTWIINWDDAVPLSTIYLKLGTYARQNPCILTLSLHKRNDGEGFSDYPTAKGSVDGKSVCDNQFTPFYLDAPVSRGTYQCRLVSKNTEGSDLSLALWITIRKTIETYGYSEPDLSVLNRHMADLHVSNRIGIVLFASCGMNRDVLDSIRSIYSQIYPYYSLTVLTNASQTEGFAKTLSLEIPTPPVTPRVIAMQPNMNPDAVLDTGAAFTAFICPGDALTKDALYETALACYPNTEGKAPVVVYSDEDVINKDHKETLSKYIDPFFKPDYSPELLFAMMYMGNLTVYRNDILKKVLSRSFFEDPNAWDLCLKMCEHAVTVTDSIRHIPKILFHRSPETSYAPSPAAGLRAVKDALLRKKRLDDSEGLADLTAKNTCLVRYPAKKHPLVSIIIPSKNLPNVLNKCLLSITDITATENYEIIIVDNGSDTNETFALYDLYKHKIGKRKFKLIHDGNGFNFSRLVNNGVQNSKGELVLLLNNDTELIGSPYWLSELSGYAMQKEIGCVGARLIYPDDTIQHAGIISGVGDSWNHGHKGFPRYASGYQGMLTIVTNCSAVTGACLMVKRDLWEMVGGFDENLAISFNDVDFCLKILDMGFRHACLPHVMLYHFESKSRGEDISPNDLRRLQSELDTMRKRWGKILLHDPFYNPHLSKLYMDYRVSHTSVYHYREG